MKTLLVILKRLLSLIMVLGGEVILLTDNLMRAELCKMMNLIMWHGGKCIRY